MVSWVFGQNFVDGATIKSQQGPNLKMHGSPSITAIGDESVVRFDGRQDFLEAVGDWKDIQASLPHKTLTIACWVSVDETQANGGIVSALQDNGNREYGWVLGYNESVFTFGLSTTGANDGDGLMTYLAGETAIQLGRWHHVVASYDGEEMQLWVDGKLDGRSKVQSGAILYPEQAKLAVGAYVDDNEQYLHRGRLSTVVIYDVAAQEKWVKHDFEHQAQWTELPAESDPSLDFQFLVKPYLQFGTTDSMRVLCELTKPGNVTIEFGETSDFGRSCAATSDDGLLHAALLDGLQPETGYYYQVVVNEVVVNEVVVNKDVERSVPEASNSSNDATVASVRDAKLGTAQPLRSEVLSFQTASLAGRPFSFIAVGDTQGNPQVNGRIAEMAWALRPNFAILPGDLVDDGTKKQQWIHEFFASMNPLMSRVPLYPVLGNHERNADHYYRYMDLPPPEYYYSFRYGNAVFFMLDSNKKLDADSEQYVWLEKQLANIEAAQSSGESDVVWKFVSFHHPIYSSDENDYGDLWKGKSTWGDLRLRPLTALFDRYGMDVVWNGHIHSYERTWPLLEGEAVATVGTTYMVTGGGGGGLEQAGPIRPWFQNNVRRGHHFVFVAINGRKLELKSFDLEGRLFDTVTIDK